MMSDPEPSLSVGESEHLRILTALAEGVHPLTGQPLPDDSVYQHAKVLRALQSAISALKRGKTKRSGKPRREGQPPQSGKPWPQHEVGQLLHAFEAGIGIDELAQRHGRTRRAIEARLEKLGKIQPDPRWAEADAKREKKSENLLPPRPMDKQIASIPEKDIPY